MRPTRVGGSPACARAAPLASAKTAASAARPIRFVPIVVPRLHRSLSPRGAPRASAPVVPVMVMVVTAALVHHATAQRAQQKRQGENGENEFARHRSSPGASCARSSYAEKTSAAPSPFRNLIWEYPAR